jgi:hypothetical protein
MSYRDDLDAAVNRASALDRENEKLREALEATKVDAARKKETKVKCPECKGPFYQLGLAAFFGTIGAILALGVLGFLFIVITEHGARNCYVEAEGLTFTLNRTIDWGKDRTVGKYRSMQEALDDAAKIHCKVE